MKYLYSCIICLLAILLCSCNKEGDITVIVEDGQPTVEVMILGKWQPTIRSWVNLETGEIYSQEPLNGEDFLEFFEDGTFGFSGDRMDWRADNEDFSVYLDGDYWDIASLTERLMRLYREGKPNDKGYVPNGWLVYDFDRIGGFEADGEENEQPSTSTVHHISMIETDYSTSLAGHIYTFSYDEKGRMKDVKIRIKDSTKETYKISYSFDNEKVNITTNHGNYKGILNKEGCVETVLQQSEVNTDWTTYASISYNKDGQMTKFSDCTMTYLDRDRVSEGKFEFSYSDIENKTIPDLNSFISAAYSSYGLSFAHFEPFALPDLFGEPSKHLISEERTPKGYDFYYRYEYEQDKQGRVSRVICSSIDQVSGNNNVLNTTTYTITYED